MRISRVESIWPCHSTVSPHMGLVSHAEIWLWSGKGCI